MNSHGQVVLYALMITVVLIIIALSLANPLQTIISNARNTTLPDGTAGLDCGNESISDFDKGTCVISDVSLPYFIGAIIGIGLVVLGARFVMGGADE